MMDPIRPFLDFSERTMLTEPACNPCESEDACALHLVEGVAVPCFRRDRDADASVADFLTWFRERAAAEPAILGGLAVHDAGRLMAAQEGLLDRFSRARHESDKAADDDKARRLMKAEFNDEIDHPVGGRK